MEGMTGYVMPLEPPAVGWDIHCHTAFSDGTETPATLAEQSKALGLKGVAISDHDTTAGWPEAEAAAHRVGLPLLRGTEITATDENVSVHMLGYQYDPTNQRITDLFANTRAARLQRTQRMVELLSRDYPITWQSVLAQVKEGGKTTIGRPHIADALVSAGVYRTRSEAFADAVSASSKYYIPTPSPTSHEVVAAVKGAGGVILIAHAGDVSRNRRLLSDDQIEALISEGLDGWRYGTVAIHRSNENGCSPSAAGTSCWSPVGLTGMAKANRTNWGRTSPTRPLSKRSFIAACFRYIGDSAIQKRP